MKKISWLMLAIPFLVGGCTQEFDRVQTAPEVNQEVVKEETLYKTVTTLDGALTPFGCSIQTLRSGEIYQICKPANWNGDLIMYAHGYVSAYEPLALPTEADDYAPFFIGQGYAFATTSYSSNGLAIQSGIDDMINLRKSFIKQYGQPNHIYLTGGSEGGVITTLAVERYPRLFSGGLSLCGPCGDFQRQINHYGDFRVLFDFFFPGVLPGNAINIPPNLIENWASYVPAIAGALQSDPFKTQQLLATAGLAFVPVDPASIGQAVVGLLWYDVFASGNANQVLKGQPYDNTDRVYINPFATPEQNAILNQMVQRFTGDKKAMKTIEKDYQTSGAISIPLVTMHTDGDFLIPIWHLPLYQAKTVLQGTSSLFTPVPIPQRFGHCTFQPLEVVLAFGALVQKVAGQLPLGIQRLKAQGPSAGGKVIQSVDIDRSKLPQKKYPVSTL